MTKLRTALMAATILAAGAPIAAQAQPITGLYIGGGLGYTYLQQTNASIDKLPGRSSPPLSLSQSTTVGFDGGFAGIAAIGFGVGNGVRIEVEGSYRSNSQSTTGKYAAPVATNNNNNNNNGAAPTTTSAGSENKYGVMVNALYDVNIGQRWIFPYIGAGFGYQFANWQKIGLAVQNVDYGGFTTTVTPTGTIGQVAYQAIIGASFPITYVPGLAITAEYRYLGLAGNRNYNATGYTQYISNQYTNNQTKAHVSSDANHTFLLGFRYAFDAQGVGDTVAPSNSPYPVSSVPAPAPILQPAARTYLIFFDFDRADLTPRARDIVAEAVRNSARIQHTRIEVSGHADRSGDEAYNQRLSRARAEAVAQEMGRWGVPRSVMDIRSYGDTRPLVPTDAGTREPQNRRVEIVYR